jgi:hypothetical protein
MMPESQSSYPESVIKYAQSVMQSLDRVNIKRKALIVRFQLTPDMLFNAIADASMNKLIKSHDVELSTEEITVALVGCAFDAFACERIQDISITHINENGKLVYDVPGHVQQEYVQKIKDCLS